MPRDNSIKKVLVIGSGPIVIGQAAEFDYAGTQACRVLREDNIEIVLVNSNPATIMTDTSVADKIYVEPLTVSTIKRIIEMERPDSVLSGLGGQTGLTLCMQLAKDGILERLNIRLLGSNLSAIERSEDRRIFKDTMAEIGEPTIPSDIATDVLRCVEIAGDIGYPVVVRPAYTLGGSGGGFADDKAALVEIATVGLEASPIHQVLIEKSVKGWKEIEFEVIRDNAGNVITVCSMENIDPVGVHTGDSIVVAPAITLSDKEYQMLRSAALNIITALDVRGGCNCQFALNTDSFEYAVIEVNPRVSRSSALASKATGYPIAKVATKIAIGYNLDEIVNAVTGVTYAAFEPTIDYVAVKFPKWPFDKFVYAKKELGTQMKATGEVMAIGDSFEHALLKAVRGAEIGLSSLEKTTFMNMTADALLKSVETPTDERLFAIYALIKKGASVDDIFNATKIDRWFLGKLKNIADAAEQLSFAPKAVSYKMVDTCAGEFSAATPYFYSVDGARENEALAIAGAARGDGKRIVVLGSGPIRIGQGIEFDYACVHCVQSLKKLGYKAIVINNNPETVSTDFDTADRLYFEPLTTEDVLNVLAVEEPIGVIAAFGGGTAIKLTQSLSAAGVNIIGTSADSIDLCEDRNRFDNLLEELNIKRPKGFAVSNELEAIGAAQKLGYPVLMRPSYVLGGQNMIIAYSQEDITEYMEVILRVKQDNPVLIDKYLNGLEIEVDAICDGAEILIPGILEHIERTGVHSGDSIALYPAARINDDTAAEIYELTRRMCLALKVKGLVNIQYVVRADGIFVIEVNPRASRTVPYISKVTGIGMCDLATRAALGESLTDMGVKPGIAAIPPYTAVKVPVFSFEKLTDLDTQLGPEMKSTGEVLGIGKNIQEALYKGLRAAGFKMRQSGGVFISVRDSDKSEACSLAKKYAQMGFELFATASTGAALAKSGLRFITVKRIYESASDNALTLLESGKIHYVISTSTKGRDPARDSVKIRRKATMLAIPCLTSLDTANALADSLLSNYRDYNTELVNLNDMRNTRLPLKFTKMQGAGNDYIYVNCFDVEINSPECLSVLLSDRHYGIGSDGVILIMRSNVADARMRMFNLDGSEGKMCGNGIRCVAKFLYDNDIARKRVITVETMAGIKELFVTTMNSKVSSVRVDMGAAVLDPVNVPTTLEGAYLSGFGNCVVNRRIVIGDNEYGVTCVSMGNPHCVVFMDDIDALEIDRIGPLFEHADIFPEGVNTEFVSVISRNELKMRVWERGSGETFACGTGTCATTVAAVLNGHCDRNTDVKVRVKGGELIVSFTDETVYMTGDCVTVFDGTVLI